MVFSLLSFFIISETVANIVGTKSEIARKVVTNNEVLSNNKANNMNEIEKTGVAQITKFFSCFMKGNEKK